MERAEAIKKITGVPWNGHQRVDGSWEYEQGPGDAVAFPTEEAIAAMMESDRYRELRAPEYPPIQDLADALVHQAMGDGNAALDAYLSACEAVKVKYPKP